jgi:hypothetical protein
MKNEINIGTGIDTNDLLQSRALIQANSGGGKSVLARNLMEEAFGKVPFIVLDNDGEYYSLKEIFGDLVIIGGSFADVPISTRSVKLLVKEIISNRLSVVIDLSDLKTGEKVRYVKDFLETLMDLPKEYWIPYLVFIEEAHKFCGEQDKQESAGAVKDLMSRGRKKGYCGILITQRISKLHKDAAAECNNKFIGRTNLDIDMDRASRELGFTSTSEFTRHSLRDLQPGTFFAYGTSLHPHHVHLVKVKMPRSKIIKVGNISQIKPLKPTPKLISALAKLNELPQEAEKELKTILELQKEIARLQQELKKSSKLVPTAGTGQTKIQNQESEKKLADNARQILALQKQLQQCYSDYAFCYSICKDLSEVIKNVHTLSSENPLKKYPRLAVPKEYKAPVNESKPSVYLPAPVAMPKIAQHSVSVGSGSLKGAEAKIIKFLAQFPDRSFSQAQIAVATGYTLGGGGFNNALGKLNTLGFIIRGPKISVNSSAMDSIVEAVGEIIPKQYGYENFKEQLTKAEREIYEVLISSPDQVFTKEELAANTTSKYQPDGGGFNNAVGRLATLELLVRPQKGYHQLNPELLEL